MVEGKKIVHHVYTGYGVEYRRRDCKVRLYWFRSYIRAKEFYDAIK